MSIMIVGHYETFTPLIYNVTIEIQLDIRVSY